VGCGDASSGNGTSNIPNLGPLGEPDANGLRLPAGFTSRVLGRSGVAPVSSSPYLWHPSPDGGAVFPAPGDGWIYVSNCEFAPGAVGAMRFSRDGTLVDAYPILSDRTVINCAGGPTPWGTWLTCEEHPAGRVWECDPLGEREATARPALGVFQHEAVAVDPDEGQLYLTEDVPDGRFYRFTAERPERDGSLDLSRGVLEVARVLDPGGEGEVVWHVVPDPSGASMPTRLQVAESTPFRGGEGIWFHDGVAYVTTKGDNRVWAYETRSRRISVMYDDERFTDAILHGVDNVTASRGGDVLVAEDGDDMQIVALRRDAPPVAIVQVVGHPASEVTGPAFDPSGTRLYFSSQRGASGDLRTGGVTYEVSGPFHSS